VPFTDEPANFSTNPVSWSWCSTIPENRRREDAARLISSPTLQHYGQPDVDAASYRLIIDVSRVRSRSRLSLDELRKIGTAELVAGFGSGFRQFARAGCTRLVSERPMDRASR
jgi:hypothetical protein